MRIDVTQEGEMTPDQKIAEAKRLLAEATDEIRTKRNREIDAHACQCGHRRDQHCVTTSINYTQGYCRGLGCKCSWFLMREA